MVQKAKTPQWYVYALKDPRTDEVRYVGCTRSLANRLAVHIYKARKQTNKRALWIQDVLRAGLSPTLCVLETGVGDGGEAAEMRYIQEYRAAGCDLANSTDGGKGSIGYKHSDERRAALSASMKGRDVGKKYPDAVRARMSAAQRARPPEDLDRARERLLFYSLNRSEETRAKLAAANKGRKWSDETRAKIMAARQNVSEETRAKLSAAVMARPLEQREQFAKSNAGRTFSPEHREKMAKAARARWARVRAEKGKK